MTPFASGGQVVCGPDGSVYVRIWGELHYLGPGDAGRLLFSGERVSLLRKAPAAPLMKGALPDETLEVSGSVYLNPSGRGVVIESGGQQYILPRDRFLAVALGEEVSCIFFELPANETGMGMGAPRLAERAGITGGNA